MRSQRYRAPHWRFRYLLQVLGPYTRIAELLHGKGYPLLPENTITAWAHRNSIPSSWLPAVIALALESRVIGSIEDLKEPGHVKRTLQSHPEP